MECGQAGRAKTVAGYNRAQVNGSSRTDVDNSWLPDYALPKPGLAYFDTYEWSYVHEARSPEVRERLRQLTSPGP